MDEWYDYGGEYDGGDYGGSEYVGDLPYDTGGGGYESQAPTSWTMDPWYGDGGQDVYLGGGGRYQSPTSPGGGQGGLDAWGRPNYASDYGIDPNWSKNYWASQGGGGGGFSPPGPRGAGAMNPEMISLGQPPDDLFNLYSKFLKDPSTFAKDPSFQFLYNQGLQSLKRTLAAKRLSLSGKAMSDAQEYGQNFAGTWLQRMLPEYRAGAGLEYQRYMGPAGLQPSYAASNNRAISDTGRSQASQDLIPQFSDAYKRMLAGQPGGNSPVSPVGFGGQGSGYVQPRLESSYGLPPAGGGGEAWGEPYTGSGPVDSYYDPGELDNTYL